MDDEVCVLELGDPTPDLCTIVTTKISEEENTTDMILLSRLNVYLHMVEEQLRDPSLSYFPPTMAVYAQHSIQELEKLRAQYHRVQRASAAKLKVGQVLMPCLSFQITTNETE